MAASGREKTLRYCYRFCDRLNRWAALARASAIRSQSLGAPPPPLLPPEVEPPPELEDEDELLLDELELLELEEEDELELLDEELDDELEDELLEEDEPVPVYSSAPMS